MTCSTCTVLYGHPLRRGCPSFSICTALRLAGFSIWRTSCCPTAVDVACWKQNFAGNDGKVRQAYGDGPCGRSNTVHGDEIGRVMQSPWNRRYDPDGDRKSRRDNSTCRGDSRGSSVGVSPLDGACHSSYCVWCRPLRACCCSVVHPCWTSRRADCVDSAGTGTSHDATHNAMQPFATHCVGWLGGTTVCSHIQFVLQGHSLRVP